MLCLLLSLTIQALNVTCYALTLTYGAYHGFCTDWEDFGRHYLFLSGDAPNGTYTASVAYSNGAFDSRTFTITGGHASGQYIGYIQTTGSASVTGIWTIDGHPEFGGAVMVYTQFQRTCGECDPDSGACGFIHGNPTTGVPFVEGSLTIGLGASAVYHKTNDKKLAGDCGSGATSADDFAMARYEANASDATLTIHDTPFRYQPARGPAINFSVVYQQQDDGIPNDASNLGPNWMFNWISYVADKPNKLDAAVRLFAPGGGVEAYSGFDTSSSNSASLPDPQSGAVLVRVTTSPIKYEKRFSDGSIAVYKQSDNASSDARRVFLSEIKDPAGHVVTVNYESSTSRKIVSLTDDLGYVTTLLYDNNTNPLRVVGVQEPNFTGGTDQRTATFDYTGSRLTTITDQGGIQSSVTYKPEPTPAPSATPAPPANFVDSLTTPYGTSHFDTATTSTGRWLTMKDPEGGRERVEYASSTSAISGSESVTPSGTDVTITNSSLNTANTFYWDKKYTEPFGSGTISYDYTQARVTHWALNSHNIVTGIVASEKAPLENRVWYNYDGQSDSNHVGLSGKPIRIARVLNNSSPSASSQIWRYEYNNAGNVTKVTDPTSHVRTYIYGNGNDTDVTEIHQKTGSNDDLVRSMSYNSYHQVEYDTDAAEQTTHFVYNTKRQVHAVTDPNGDITTYGYDRDDDSNSETDGYLISITSPEFNSTHSVTTLGYDSNKRVHTVTTSPDDYTVTTDYDNLDRPTQITYPDTTQQLFFYSQDFGQADPAKKILDLTASVDRRGYQTQRVYNRNRQVTDVTEDVTSSTTRTTHYEWCKCGALASITDANNHTTAFNRDLQSRVYQKVFHDTKTIDYLYEGQSTSQSIGTSSRLKSTTDGNLHRTNYSYLLDNDLQQISYTDTDGNPLSPVTPAVSFFYQDSNYNRLTKMSDGTGDTLYTYHPVGEQGANQLYSVNGPLPNSPIDDTIYYAYDKLGRLTSRTINGVSSATPFDSLGRPGTTTNSVLGSFTRAYDLDVTPRLKTLTAPSGQTSNYSYFGVSNDLRLQTSQDLTTGSANVSKFDYTYDFEGQIQTWIKQLASSAAVTSTFANDRLDRVTGVTNSTPDNPSTTLNYDYDPGDNRKSDNIVSDYLNNPVNQIGLTGYVYDNNGNLTSDGVNTYEWDAANRLTSIIYPDDGGRTDFTYDGLGRRVKFVEKDGNGSTQRTARFLYDGAAIAEERGSTVVLKRFFPEGVQIVSGVSPNAKLIYSKDHLGSVRSLTNENGTILSTIDYDPYGGISRAPVPSNSTSGPGPVVTAAVSRMTHGSAGDFDVNLTLNGAPGIEMRNGSGNYTLVLTFDQSVSAGTATIASGVGAVSGSPSYSGSTATVQLSGVADRQTVTLELDNVVGTGGTTDKVFVSMSVCVGDSNQNGAVTIQDLSLVSANTGNTLDSTTFKYDTNHDGAINSADVSQTKVMQAQAASLFPDFAFTGHYYHARSGLYLTMYRAYSPTIGRWLSRDPLRTAEIDEGPNLYAYVKNNATNRVDPFGLNTWYSNFNGHSSITVTDPRSSTGYSQYDYFPTQGGYQNPFATWHSPGEMRRTEGHPMPGAVDLDTNAAQDEAVRAAGDRYVDDGGTYDPLTNNCATVSRNMMADGGLTPHEPSWAVAHPTTVRWQAQAWAFIRGAMRYWSGL